MAKTEETRLFYLDTGKRLTERYERDTGLLWRDDLDQFALWVEEHVNNDSWSKGTWKIYRLGIVEFLADVGAPLHIINQIDALRTAKKPSQKRGKKFAHHEILNQYIDVLSHSSGTLDDMLSRYLSINSEVGMRPGEWGRARIIGDLLVIQNEKTTNGRSNGRIRSLRILDEDILARVKYALEERDRLVQMEDWDKLIVLMRKRLGEVRRNKDLPHITLYSTRHQFSANAKSAGLSRRTVADLMGHASDTTAGRHYGKKYKGSGNLFVEYVPEWRIAELSFESKRLRSTLNELGGFAPD